MPLDNATSKNDPREPSKEVIDKIVLLLVSGLARSSIEEAAHKLGLDGESAASAIAEARTRIQIAAHWEPEEQMGTALVRLNDIYRRALAVQDAKTALAVQRELNRLLDLYRAPREPTARQAAKATKADNQRSRISRRPGPTCCPWAWVTRRRPWPSCAAGPYSRSSVRARPTRQRMARSKPFQDG